MLYLYNIKYSCLSYLMKYYYFVINILKYVSRKFFKKILLTINHNNNLKKKDLQKSK